jgi:hypothetical protein
VDSSSVIREFDPLSVSEGGVADLDELVGPEGS